MGTKLLGIVWEGDKHECWTVIKAGRTESVIECKCGYRRTQKNCILLRHCPKQCRSCAGKERDHPTRLPRVVDGQTFGSWTIIDAGKTESLAECKCGARKLQRNRVLLSLRSAACKDCQLAALHDGNKGNTHRRSGPSDIPTNLYRRLMIIVNNAIDRCTNSDLPQWDDYGGRGIKVCSEWTADRGEFVAYLATLEGCEDPSLIIDRTDNDKGYEPGNLRFVTRSESNFNRDYGRKKRNQVPA